MKVRNRLRVVRAEQRCTQMRLAMRAKVPQCRISFIENGYSQPSPREQARIAKALRVSVEYVFPESVPA
jgi:transcriptional regulator with XRE-family HTH domain